MPTIESQIEKREILCPERGTRPSRAYWSLAASPGANLVRFVFAAASRFLCHLCFARPRIAECCMGIIRKTQAT